MTAAEKTKAFEKLQEDVSVILQYTAMFDERTTHTLNAVEEIKEYNKKQNGHVADHCRILNRHTFYWRIVGLFTTLLVASGITCIIGVWQ